MSWHDAVLILGSIIATTVVLQLLGAFAPDLRAIIRIDFRASGDPFAVVLNEKEYAYFGAHLPPTLKRVVVRAYSGRITFDVFTSLEPDAPRSSIEWLAMPPNYPQEVWEANVDEKVHEKNTWMPEIIGETFSTYTKLILQFEPLKGALVLGLVDGRFGKGMLGEVKKENVLVTIPLDMAKLKKMRMEPIDKDAPWERWNFFAGIKDPEANTFYWEARCVDVFGHSRSLR
jgi:hypothetical protein